MTGVRFSYPAPINYFRKILMKTFIQQCIECSTKVEDYDDFIDFWHTSETARNVQLHEAFGLSQEEYSTTFFNHDKFIAMLNQKIKQIQT
jgi:hypothetical protein